ncbi:hypothetical protein LTR22_027045 [Elasticomyces elasticus]|nr:hypothetical protein LTR22_027045 [Elasticomyces elasticus]
MTFVMGDVVVSDPRGQSGGVIQYDLMKAHQQANPSPGANDSVSELTGHIGAPPQALQKVVTYFSTRHEREESKIPAIMEDALEKYHKLKISKKWDRPSSEKDLLFLDLLFQETFYRNGELSWKQKVGEDYRPEGEYIRPVRDDSCPVVHLGIIGSGNALEKDVKDRERILPRMLPAEALCLEMESGGVMNVFSSLVIRDICDYGDRRKNDMWQAYAALAAAAYAKEILCRLAARTVQGTPKAWEQIKTDGK